MRETTRERENRQRAEDFAAIRAAATPADRATVAQAPPGTEWPAGERLTLKAGTRRTIEVDHGRVLQVIHGDALERRGYAVTSRRMSFGIGSGQGARYSITARPVPA